MKDSKDKLLRTAFELFALRGMEGVSTREIVKKAGVNIHAISYYFGGKDGLYKAVVDYLINIMQEESRHVLHFNEYTAAARTINKKEAFALLLKILGEFIDFDFLPKNKYVALFLTREDFSPTKHNKRFYDKIMAPAHDLILTCICKITGLDFKDEKAVILCHMIMAQVASFGRGGRHVLRNLNRKEYDIATISLIKEMLFTNIQAVLKAYTKEEE